MTDTKNSTGKQKEKEKSRREAVRDLNFLEKLLIKMKPKKVKT
jgi:hypothetical protein